MKTYANIVATSKSVFARLLSRLKVRIAAALSALRRAVAPVGALSPFTGQLARHPATRFFMARPKTISALAATLLALATVPFMLANGEDGIRTSMLNGNYKRAYHRSLDAAKKGNSQAANTLGNLYYVGLGVDRNYYRAAYWYERAALAGYGPAQVNLGHLYSQGLGVQKDAVKTLGWYWLAKIGGYGAVESHLQIKLDELQLVPGLIQKAQTQFSSLEKVKKRIAQEKASSPPSMSAAN